MSLEFDKFSLTDLIQAVTTVLGVFFAVIYVKQSNATLKELKRQNDLTADPVLRFRLTTTGPSEHYTTLEECKAESSTGDLNRFRKEWEEHLDMAAIPYQKPGTQYLTINLQNKGSATVENIRIRLKMRLEHHANAKEHLRREPTEREFSLDLLCDIENGSPEIQIPLITIDSFPNMEVTVLSVDYRDVRGKTHVLPDIARIRKLVVQNLNILPRPLLKAPTTFEANSELLKLEMEMESTEGANDKVE